MSDCPVCLNDKTDIDLESNIVDKYIPFVESYIENNNKDDLK